jgi:CBS domain-containing protein
MQAKDLMVGEFELVPNHLPLLEAVDKMRQIKLETGRIDVRCLVISDDAAQPRHLVTEGDIIRAILPWFFRDKRFSNFVGKWLSSDLPQASLNELWSDLARAARKKKVKDVITEGATLVSVDESDSLVKIAYLMHQERIKSVPVTREGRIVGIVFRSAVFEAVASEIVKPKFRISSKPEVRSPEG